MPYVQIWEMLTLWNKIVFSIVIWLCAWMSSLWTTGFVSRLSIEQIEMVCECVVLEALQAFVHLLFQYNIDNPESSYYGI